MGIFNAPISQTGRILKHMQKHGQIRNSDMWNMHIQRGSERIRELKAEGYKITSEHVEGALWVYRYHGHQDDVE